LDDEVQLKLVLWSADKFRRVHNGWLEEVEEEMVETDGIEPTT
jgi:hypothetical protein